ncbi:MAG: hypothetical protein AAB484_00795 [Patescibacteria group bacterium]
MNTTIIDAGSAKLAGLQIDTLSKYRAGQITINQWERFNNLSPNDREARFGDWKKPEPKVSAESTGKFALLVDLGIITVPDDYVHEKRLTTFGKQNRKKFYYYNDEITDKNFPNPTRVLKPGDKLRIRVWKQVVGGTTTSEERMAFLATQKAVYTGAQGLSLVFDQKSNQLPKGKWYVSFDEPKRLWQSADGHHWVPYVHRYSNDDFKFDLGRFVSVWRGSYCLLCFCDE